MLSSQYANAECAAAAARNANVHPYVFASFPPKDSVMRPRLVNTIALAMRTRAKPRRWRYSQGAMMSRIPDRGGDVHRERRPFGAGLLSGACIRMPPVGCRSVASMTYQDDITLILGCQERPRTQGA